MITNNVSKAVFLGNGVATQFPFVFKVWEASQLFVEITDTENVATVGVGWTAELAERGGTITYLHNGVPLPSGYKLTILRNMPFLQEVDLINGTRFDPSVIEQALDKATAERQQLIEEIQRAIKVPASSENPPELLAQEIFEARDEALASATQSAQSAVSAEEALKSIEDFIPTVEEAASTAQENALTSINRAKDAALQDVYDEASKAEDFSLLAQRWAESDTPPDPATPDSHSAKWWALWLSEQTGQSLPDATTTTKGKVRLATSAEIEGGTGIGVITSQNLEAKVLPIVQNLESTTEKATLAFSKAEEALEAAEHAGVVTDDVTISYNTQGQIAVKTLLLASNPTEEQALYPAAVSDVFAAVQAATNAHSRADAAYAKAEAATGLGGGADTIIDYYPKTEAEKALARKSWWRKWKSGFIEQGGYHSPIVNPYTVTLLVPMTTTNYNVQGSYVWTGASGGEPFIHVLGSTTTTSFKAASRTGWSGVFWEVKGF